MCVLCGEMVVSMHWSEGVREEGCKEVVVGELQRERLRNRLQKVRIAQNILRFYGLSLKEWQGSKFVLSDAKGQSAIVPNLGALWEEAAKMAKRQIDVLDPNLLAYLRSQNG